MTLEIKGLLTPFSLIGILILCLGGYFTQNTTFFSGVLMYTGLVLITSYHPFLALVATSSGLTFGIVAGHFF